MTPNAIEILIHCHVSPLPHPRIDAPAVANELDTMRANGLIEPMPSGNGCYMTTARGRAHIEQLCRTAWPTTAWVGADGKIIELDG